MLGSKELVIKIYSIVYALFVITSLLVFDRWVAVLFFHTAIVFYFLMCFSKEFYREYVFPVKYILLYFLTVSVFYFTQRGGNYGFLESQWMIIESCFFFLLAFFFFKKNEDKRDVLGWGVIALTVSSAAFYIAYFYIVKNATGRLEGLGFLRHSILGSYVLLSYWMIGTILAYDALGERRFYFWLFSAAVIFTFIYLSGSRAPAIAFITFFMAFVLSKLISNSTRRSFIQAGVIFGLLAVTALYFLDVNAFLVRGLSYRDKIWMSVLENSNDWYPFGFGVFEDFRNSLTYQNLFQNYGVKIEHVHNTYLNFLFEGGPVFFIFGVSLFVVYPLYKIVTLKAVYSLKFLYVGFAMSVIIMNLTDTAFLVNKVGASSIFFWFTLAFLFFLVEVHNKQGVSR